MDTETVVRHESNAALPHSLQYSWIFFQFKKQTKRRHKGKVLKVSEQSSHTPLARRSAGSHPESLLTFVRGSLPLGVASSELQCPSGLLHQSCNALTSAKAHGAGWGQTRQVFLAVILPMSRGPP